MAAPPPHGGQPVTDDRPGSDARSGPRLCPVLVGRDDLVALADRRLSAASGGTGELLFLAGEAGIGKTRLLAEITARAAAAGFAVAGAAAFSRDAEIAGGLLADLAADLRRSPATAEVGHRIWHRLRSSVDGDGDAHRQRRLLIADLSEALVSLPDGSGPVLVTLEDLHWADDSTLEVLARVARRLSALPILVVGTYRSDELYPSVAMRRWRARLLTQRLAEEVRLGRLDAAGTAAMVAAMAPTAPPSAVAGAVFARSDGIPLHVEEFLAMASDGSAELPDTLAEAVLARANLLTAPARALAGAASVIGRSFDLDLLTAVNGAEPGVVDAGLRELSERFFVDTHTDTYDFRHALIREALYADLTPHLRRELHARAAEAAVSRGGSEAFISDHYERAHQPALAYRYATAGAAAAVAMSAHREAVELYRRAQRTAPAGTPDGERADLLTALAGELAAIDDNTAAEAAYAEAYGLRRRLGDNVAAAALLPPLVAVRHLLGAGLAERTRSLQDALSLIADERSTRDLLSARGRIYAALAAAYMLDRRLDESIHNGEHARTLPVDDTTMCDIDATLGSVLVFAGRLEEGWRLLRGAVTRAVDAGAEAAAARGYRMLSTCASALLEYDRALRWLAEGIEYAERAERFNDRHYMTAHLGHVHWAVGDWPAAEREARHALADGRGGITTTITALHVLGYVALGRSDWAAAERHLTEASELGGQMGELQRMSPAWWGLAELALRRGGAEECVAWCERGYAASAAVRDAAYLFPYVVTSTRAYLELGRRTEARDWLDRCRELLLARAIPGTLAAVDHAGALVDLHDGQTGKARAALASAAVGWDAQRRFWEGTQVLGDQAVCAHRSRRPAEAAAFAREARERAAAAGATALLPTRAVPAEAVLTSREVEVANLVATGATNRQIAAALSIAPKTVAAHVEHILAKLGANRRTQIATWATKRPS